MNEPQELLERSLRSAFSKEVDVLIQQLDQRMKRHLLRVQRTRSKRLPVSVLRPAVTFVMLAVALGVGYYWGHLNHPAFSPQTLHSEQAKMVFQSEEPAALALYTYSNTLNRDVFGVGLAPTKVIQQSLGAQAEADMEGATSGSIAALAPQPSESVAARARGVHQSYIWPGVASVGFLGNEIVVPTDDALVRWTLDGEKKVVVQALRHPIGVSVDGSGRIFATEHQANGALIAVGQNGKKTTILEGLNYPAGIAFAKDHSLYLAEQGRGRVLRFLPLGDQITPESRVEVFATGFSGLLETDTLWHPLPQGGPFALTVTPNNELLVSDLVAGKTVIYRFRLDHDINWWDWLFKTP